MHNLADLIACCWTTVSKDAGAIDATQATARARHRRGAIIESCQRTEAYAFGGCDCAAPLRLHGAEALFHLAEVAAGLHSVVLGEAQILGQVRQGCAESTGELRRLADVALAAARELRRETNFNSHAGALLDRGLKAAGHPPGGRLLVLGVGQMGRLVADRGTHLGFSEVVVASRTRPAEWSGSWVALSRAGSIEPVDVVAGCLGSGAGVVGPGALPAAGLLLDLGTPRNFDGDYGAPIVTLAGLLSDEERRPHAVRRRRRLRQALRLKVEERLAAARLDGQSPVGALRSEVERIRQEELGRMQRLHPEIAPETLDTITRSLVNQLFHAPSARLKAHDDTAFGREVAALFTRP